LALAPQATVMSSELSVSHRHVELGAVLLVDLVLIYLDVHRTVRDDHVGAVVVGRLDDLPASWMSIKRELCGKHCALRRHYINNINQYSD
jgi:hypothetical protein